MMGVILVDTYLKELNEEQLLAVKTTEGYVRVIAGAGSGKTKTLTSRFIYLVKSIGISPANILCVTFTNKAAAEMRKRVEVVIKDLSASFICTFHGFCVRVLRDDIYILNYPRNFNIIDEDDVESVLKKVYEQLDINSSYMTFEDAKKYISYMKLSGQYIDLLIKKDFSDILERYNDKTLSYDVRIFYGYLYEQRKNFSLDFDDLIYFVYYIFKKNEIILNKWQKRLNYIMVDEFQDVSKRQYDLCEMLSEYHKNLFVVGDPDQTIYSWRGADVGLLLNFEEFHSNCKTIVLNKNYRSTKNILKAANSLISKNKNRFSKDLISLSQIDIPVEYYHAKSTKEEADWVSLQIKEIINRGYNYCDIAILYRSNYVSRSIEQSLLENGISYRIYNGTEFFKRREIKDVLAYLKMIAFSDDLSFERIINVPKRNFGEKRMTIIKEYAQKYNVSYYQALKDNLNDSLIQNTSANEFVELIEKFKKQYKSMMVSDIFAQIIDKSGYENYLKTLADDDRLENISELKNTIIEFENKNQEDYSLEEYLTSISLYTDVDIKESGNQVKLMTIHSAKGLEFPFVFVCGLNEGVFPSSRSVRMAELEEERRIAYVAFTRAEKKLFLTDAEGYNYNNSFRYPSRFIFNAGKDNLNYVVELNSELYNEAQGFIENAENNLYDQVKCFEIGDRVFHEKFGKGTIVDINEMGSEYAIKFDNLETNRNLSFGAQISKINDEFKDE